MPLERISHQRKSVQVAEQLLREIQRGTYAPGGRIPTEEEIALQTGVSRTAVREAMAALRLAGVVESRGGAGTFIRRAPGAGMTGFRALAILQEQASPSEMIEARKAIELGVATLAARRADAQDHERLHAIVRGMEQAVERRDHQGYLRLNKEFHLAVAQATHNRAVVQTMETLLQYMDEPLWSQFRADYYEADPRRLKRSLSVHVRLARAIRAGGSRNLPVLLREHFDRLGPIEEGSAIRERAGIRRR